MQTESFLNKLRLIRTYSFRDSETKKTRIAPGLNFVTTYEKRNYRKGKS